MTHNLPKKAGPSTSLLAVACRHRATKMPVDRNCTSILIVVGSVNILLLLLGICFRITETRLVNQRAAFLGGPRQT